MQSPYTAGDEWQHPRTNEHVQVVGVTDRTVTYRTHGMEFQATIGGFERLLDEGSLVEH